MLPDLELAGAATNLCGRQYAKPRDNAMALARFSGGKMSEMIECEGGLPPASPIPTPILAISNWEKF